MKKGVGLEVRTEGKSLDERRAKDGGIISMQICHVVQIWYFLCFPAERSLCNFMGNNFFMSLPELHVDKKQKDLTFERVT